MPVFELAALTAVDQVICETRAAREHQLIRHYWAKRIHTQAMQLQTSIESAIHEARRAERGASPESSQTDSSSRQESGRVSLSSEQATNIMADRMRRER